MESARKVSLGAQKTPAVLYVAPAATRMAHPGEKESVLLQPGATAKRAQLGQARVTAALEA